MAVGQLLAGFPLGFALRVLGRGDRSCIAVEDVPGPKILKTGLSLLLGVQQPVAGVRAIQVDSLEVDSERPRLPLEGELDESLPDSKSWRGPAGEYQPSTPAVTTLTSFVIPPTPGTLDTVSNAALLSYWCLTSPFNVSHASATVTSMRSSGTSGSDIRA
jgi:hypothetical protein